MRFGQKRLEQPGALDMNFFARFSREEDGSLTIFSLFLMLAMLLTTGLAVDVMRYESQDTLLRNTADSAVLACADLQQQQDPTKVVNDFFKARGLEHTVENVRVDQGLNFRRCDVDVQANIPTLFIDADIFKNDGYEGVDYLSSDDTSAAEERISDIEISLVLDVSGSMGNWSSALGNTRIALLHEAGQDFVDEVINPNLQGQAGTTSISIIPYNGKVNAGQELADAFNVAPQFSDGTSRSHCVRFKPEHFDYTRFPTTTVERISHYDTVTNHYVNRNNNTKTIRQPYCQTSPNDKNMIMAHEIDASVLKNKIRGLTTGGWTATDVGAKWGAVLLDPTSNNNIKPMLDSSIDTRPEAFDDPETMKVMVIMTDGDNTRQHDLEQQFKDGWSNVFYSPNADRYYVELDWRNNWERQYYLPHNDDEVWNIPNNMSDAYRLSWEDLMGRYNLEYVSEFFFDRYNWLETAVRNAEDEFTNDTNAAGNALADANLLSICEEARKENIVVFTVAFAAPSHAQGVLADCVGGESSPNYFGVTDIGTAFDMIAAQINQLKLIQ